MNQNSFAGKINAGITVYGTCITSTAPLWGKAARLVGLDFVFKSGGVEEQVSKENIVI